MKILLACEESQEVCIRLREKGHEAYSCDIQECSGDHPEWHIMDDVINVINGWRKVIYVSDCKFEEWDESFEVAICPNCKIDFSDCICPGCMQNDIYEYKEINNVLYAKEIDYKNWDMMIAFPPCTHLAVSGAKHFEQKRKDGRQQEGIDFFMAMVNAPIEKIAIENPIGIMSKLYRKPDQIVHPYFFGDPFTKSTCFWLKNLPKLVHYAEDTMYNKKTHTDKGEFKEFMSKKGVMKKQALWYYNAIGDGKTRSKTFPGIAQAMADQWG